MWTRFMDMHSGGSCKIPPYEYIYIELPMDEAIRYFYGRFRRNPERVTCTCCGEDYSIKEEETLANLSGFERHCKLAKGGNGYLDKGGRDFIDLQAWLQREDILSIPSADIDRSMIVSEVPQEGYIWVD